MRREWRNRLCTFIGLPMLALSLSGCGMFSNVFVPKFPPADVDHLSMRVTAKVQIAGIGEDEVRLDGMVAVHRSGPSGPEGTVMTGELIGASFRGQSDVFGEIVAVESPIRHSPCEYVYEAAGKYKGQFDLYGWFWLPKHKLMMFNTEPIRIEGPAEVIPPIGQTASLVGDEVALFSFARPAGNPSGTLSDATGEIGELVDVTARLEATEATVPDLLKGD